MGYDMYITADLTEAEALAKAAARDQFDAAVAHRDTMKMPWEEKAQNPQYLAAQAEVDAAYDKLGRHDLNYFRLNIWGMGRCRGLMAERGMIYESRSPGRWPEYDEGSEDADAEYDRLADPIRALHPEGEDTIPSHKFGSNDGWLVTEEECRAALAAEAAAGLPAPTYVDKETSEVKPVLWWPEWLAFLARAADRGGFNVR